MRSLAAAVAALVLGATVPQGGVVAGIAIDATGRPLPRTAVLLFDAATGRLTTATTDEAGNFRLEGVAAGRYMIFGSRPGYLNAEYGAPWPGEAGTLADIGAGGRTDFTLTLRKGGAISGTVRDENGDPAGVMVTASNVTRSQSRETRTDGRGQYRLPNLPPGHYLVSASNDGSGAFVTGSAGNDQKMIRLSTYYNGTNTSADATLVTVAGETDIGGIDIQLRQGPVTTMTVTLTSTMTLTAKPRVLLSSPSLPLLRDGSGVPVGYANVRGEAFESDDMRFRFLDIGPGRYRLEASASAQSESAPKAVNLFASADVTSDGVTPIEITLELAAAPQAGSQRATTLAGRLVFEGASQRTPLEFELRRPAESGDTTILTRPPLAGSGYFPPNADTAKFSTYWPSAGTYVFQCRCEGTPWRAKTAVAGGRDILDLPMSLAADTVLNDVVVTVTDRPSEVSGFLTAPDGTPLPSRMALVFPSDRRYWYPASRRIQLVLSDGTGRYMLSGLPAGEYRAVLTDLKELAPRTELTAVLTRLVPSSTAFTLADGERKTLDLPGRRTGIGR